MNDWASEQAEKLRKAISDAQSKDNVFQERQNLKREFGPRLWEEVKKSVAEKCTEFNTRMGQGILEKVSSSNDTLEVKASVEGAKAKLKARFTGDLSPLEWEVVSDPYSTGSPSGKFSLHVDQKGNVSYESDDNPPIIRGADDAAKHLLAALIGQVTPRL